MTNPVKVLLIEDDESLVKAISGALEKKGIEVLSFQDVDPAFRAISEKPFDFIIADCLLQQMTGVEFVLKAKNLASQRPPNIILMSGIFQDKDYIQEVTAQTEAIAFLKKPFNLEILINLIQQKQEVDSKPKQSARQILYGIFGKEKVTPRDKRKLIESLEEVSGYDLPFIYSLLAETKSSGFLNIYWQNGIVNGVTFSQGSIVAVDVEDKSTRVGDMLIQSGYSLAENVKKAVEDTTRNMKIGQFLIQNHQLSPHAFELILEEQMNLRLARTIVEDNIKVNFSATDVDNVVPQITAEKLLGYLHDWIASKLPAEWLNSLFAYWTTHRIQISNSFHNHKEIFDLPLLSQNSQLIVELQSGSSIASLLNSGRYNDEILLKSLHLLLTKGMIYFKDEVFFSNANELLKHLQKVQRDLESLSDLKVLEYIGYDQASDVSEQGAIDRYLKSLGTKPGSEQRDAVVAWTAIHSRLLKAVKTVKSAGTAALKQAEDRSEAENKLKATTLVEEAKKDMALGQYKAGLEKVQSAMKLESKIFQVRLYLIWGRLMTLDPVKKAAVLKEIEMELTQVPPDERYDYLFPFVSGLIQKTQGDLGMAKRSFEKCLGLDPNFMPARRELSYIATQSKSKKDLLDMDLKDVVSGFFKKK